MCQVRGDIGGYERMLSDFERVFLLEADLPPRSLALLLGAAGQPRPVAAPVSWVARARPPLRLATWPCWSPLGSRPSVGGLFARFTEHF